MFRKLVIAIILAELSTGFSTCAYTNDFDFTENENIENGDTYCIPKISIKDKIKRAFSGVPTGYTPQIQPSPYLTPNYGPSYMQGFYSGNIWNSHNIYNPTGIKLYGKSF